MTATKTPKPAPPKPWISGFCGQDMPDDSHGRCHGTYEGRPCKCPHHLVDRLLAHAHGIHVSADAMLTFPLDGVEWEDTVRVAASLRKAREAIAAAEEFLAKHAADQWPSAWRDEQHIEGVGAVNPYRPTRTKWDNEETIKAVVEHHLEESGGEIPADPYAIVRWLTDVAHIDYFRSRDLTELGVDFRELRTFEKGSVRLHFNLAGHMVGDTTREEASS